MAFSHGVQQEIIARGWRNLLPLHRLVVYFRGVISMRALLRPLSLVATFGMFLVVMMGATVTNTNSAEGCGRSWPLCQGQLIPEFAVSTLIEFSHRAVTAAESTLIITLAVGACVAYRRFLEIRVLAPMMVFSLFLQAGMGAWAVLYPQVATILALHFGISLFAFATVALTTAFIHEAETGDQPRAVAVSPAYRRAAWGTLLFSLVVVYLGAYVRHAGLDLVCHDWPLCNGKVFPLFDPELGIVFAHRLAALVLALGIAALAVWSWHLRSLRPDLARGSFAALVLVLLQSSAGAYVVFSNLGLFSALAHAGLMTLLFGSLSYLGLQSLPRLEPRSLPGRARAAQPVSAA
jgi:cytochrome c oxidase assembly protein subunit 15